MKICNAYNCIMIGTFKISHGIYLFMHHIPSGPLGKEMFKLRCIIRQNAVSSTLNYSSLARSQCLQYLLACALALTLDISTKKNVSPSLTSILESSYYYYYSNIYFNLFLVHFQAGRSINLMRGETSKRNSQYMQIEIKILFALL